MKEGLEALGHEVTLVGCGDYFKQFPVDIKLNRGYTSGLAKKIRVGIYKLTGFDLASWNIKKQFFEQKEQFKGYDIVQLINESPLGILPQHEWEIIQFLKAHNKKLFVLACGTDYLSVKYAYEKKFRYSILTPLFEGKVSTKAFDPVLKYLKPPFVKLHHRVMEVVEGVIASDLDYHIPMEGHPKYLGLIPNPINVNKIPYTFPENIDPVVIFHGINTANYYKKGSDYFEAALDRIEKKYSDKVYVITTADVPYQEYITKYDSAHIVMDQVLGFDQGYNALEAMAKGKVVFTGAETEWLQQYGLEEDTVAINALPDVEAIVSKLEALIEQPEKLKSISRNARAFVEREHDFKKIAARYLETWG